MNTALAKQNIDPPATAGPDPNFLIKLALEQNADIDKLTKLMDLQERWQKEQARKAFFDALAGFQAIVPVIKKNRKANIVSQKGSYSYKFADLGAIASQIKKALDTCGLSYRWEFKEENGKLKVTCLITHRDGHTETTTLEAGKDMSGGKNDIQQIGSTQTYLQRYSLIGALGLTTADEDNDGRGAPATQQQPELSEEEALGQWQQLVDGVTTRVELTALYMKNKKAIDKNAKIQAIFKARQEKLPPIKTTTLP